MQKQCNISCGNNNRNTQDQNLVAQHLEGGKLREKNIMELVSALQLNEKEGVLHLNC